MCGIFLKNPQMEKCYQQAEDYNENDKKPIRIRHDYLFSPKGLGKSAYPTRTSRNQDVDHTKHVENTSIGPGPRRFFINSIHFA